MGTLIIDIDRSVALFSNPSESNPNKRDQQTVTLEPRVLSLILYFHSQRNRLVTRDELIEHVWQGKVVSENAINRAVSQLRKILNRADQKSTSIETVSRKGYILQVSESDNHHSRTNDENAAEANQKNSNQSTLVDSGHNHHSAGKSDPEALSQGSNAKPLWIFGIIIFAVFILVLELIIFSRSQSLPKKFEQLERVIETSLPGVEHSARPSPDGQWLLFVHQDEKNESQALYLKPFGMSKAYPLTSDELQHFSPVWSPDGKQIAFASWNNRNQRQCHISIIDLNFAETKTEQKPVVENRRVVSRCGNRARPAIDWAANGQALFYTDRESIADPYQVFYHSLITQNKDQVSLPPQMGNFRGDFFITAQHQNNRLAIVRYLAVGQSKILVLDSHNYSSIAEFEVDFQVSRVEWFTDSDQLIIANEGNWWSYDIFSGMRTLIYKAEQGSSSPIISSDGKNFYYSQGQFNSEIELFDLTKKQYIDVAFNSSELEFAPRFIANNQIVFLSNRSGQFEFWLSNAQSQATQLSQLPFAISPTTYVVSPDHQFIYYQYHDEIYRWDINRQDNSLIIDATHRPYVVAWTDQQQLIYSSEKSGEWQLWRFDLSSGMHQQLTQRGGYSGKIIDEHWLYFTKLHQDGLWRKRLDSEEEELIIDDFPRVNWINWTITDHHIYFHQSQGATASIMRFNFATNEQVMIVPFSSQHANSFDFANDANTLAIVSNQDLEYKIIRLSID